MAKDKKRTSTETARRIWLAGIGAYGRAFTEAQEALKDVTGKGSEIFDDLVQKGEMIEKVVEIKGKSVMDKAKVPDFDMPNFDIPNFDLDERIKAMRSRLSRGGGGVPDTEEFEDRLSMVEAKLDKILSLLESKKTAPKKPARKKTTRKKPVTQRTAKTKKTAAKKQAAKKPNPKK
jgi:hypothetical protein